jgi:hypothetical protein
MSKLRVVCAVVFAGLLLAASSALAADPIGTWLGTVVPNDGPNQFTLVLAKGAAGYAGTIEDSVGKVAKKTPIEDVKWDGTSLNFSFVLADGATLVKVKAEIKGDKMTGSYVVSDGEAGTFAFEKKK